MVSVFGWLDTDETQRAKTLEIVQLFKESDTIDDLGIGSIRDTFANALFPGTSTLHTRLRYVLFIPWLLQRSATERTPDLMIQAMRRHEGALIEALAKNENDGVIGVEARRTLKNMPSVLYWSALAQWGIRTSTGHNVSRDGFFRHAHAIRSLNSRTVSADDLEARDQPSRLPLDPDLPPAPAYLLSDTSFALTAEEEDYLSTKIATATQGSLLSWFVTHPPSQATQTVWELPSDEVAALPPAPARLVDHGRRFHTAIYGAAILYNLLLAKKSEWDDRIEAYRRMLDEWQGELAETEALVGWNRTDFWQTLSDAGLRHSPLTRRFIDTWLDIATATTSIEDHRAAHELIKNREHQLKRSRARLTNRSSLDRWTGRVGLGRLDYRWGNTQRLLNDLHAARGRQEVPNAHT